MVVETTAQRVLSYSGCHSLGRKCDRDEAVAAAVDGQQLQTLLVSSIDDHPERGVHSAQDEVECHRPHYVLVGLVVGEGVHDNLNRWDGTERAQDRDN